MPQKSPILISLAFFAFSRSPRKVGDKNFFPPSPSPHGGGTMAFSCFEEWSWCFLLRLGGGVFSSSNCACFLLLTEQYHQDLKIQCL